jgi:hypothetical protein
VKKDNAALTHYINARRKKEDDRGRRRPERRWGRRPGGRRWWWRRHLIKAKARRCPDLKEVVLHGGPRPLPPPDYISFVE